MVSAVKSKLVPNSATKPCSAIGVSPPRKAAGAAIAVSSSARPQGVTRARANRTVLPATTTRLHASESNGSTR